MKLNALVKCPVKQGGEPVSGYQILTIDFESGLGGWIKKKGAIATQKIPSTLINTAVSSGRSGHTEHSSMDVGTQYSAEVSSRSTGEPLVEIAGQLAPLATSLEFCAFVVGRPHKFLAQPGQQLAFSSWAEGYDCSADGCVRVV